MSINLLLYIHTSAQYSIQLILPNSTMITHVYQLFYARERKNNCILCDGQAKSAIRELGRVPFYERNCDEDTSADNWRIRSFIVVDLDALIRDESLLVSPCQACFLFASFFTVSATLLGALFFSTCQHRVASSLDFRVFDTVDFNTLKKKS